MFEATSETFVKAIGSESLLPITSIDTADFCKPLHIVVKTKRYWIWQSPKYQPTSFTIPELLTETDQDFGVKTTSHELLSYSRSSKFSANGRLGFKIAKELVDVEVSGSDMVELEADLGRVDKLESEADDVSRALQHRHIKLSHDLVEEVQRNKRKCLCVVVATAVTTKDATISSHAERSGSAEIDVDPIARPEGKIDDQATNKITLPKGTAIAYSVRDLLVYPDGDVKLVLLEGEQGGFVSLEDSREEAKINLDIPAHELFAPITCMTAQERRRLLHGALQVATRPSAISKLVSTMKHAHYALERGANDETVDAKDLEDHVGADADEDGWKSVLSVAGFGFGDKDKIHFPSVKTAAFGAIWGLLQAMEEMSDEQLNGLEGVTCEYAGPLLYLMQTALKNQPIDKTHDKISLLFNSENLSAKFIELVGIECEGDDGSGDASTGRFVPPKNWKRKLELEAAFRVVFALHGGDAQVKELLTPTDDCCKSKCSIL